ncbi:hypothetical protein R3P38DRAFT_3150432 [Favolaschia claudopus]|uniref:Uncharacterized protein n=1 Tax=Favolaschia claudopus TaxID=2862362 RepID=A0AAV9Z1E7_9AGAR
MEQKTAEPSFSRDIEREIFETCAAIRPVSIPKLMLVAWRVKEWLEPLLYRTIAVQFKVAMEPYPIFRWDALLSTARSKSASFFRDHVRNIAIYAPYESDEAAAAKILPLCTGLTNLEVGSDGIAANHTTFANLQPTHLTMYLSPILRTFLPSHSFFARISHLVINDPVIDTHIEQCLPLLSCLTHLAIYDTPPRTILRILTTCEGIVVFVDFRRYLEDDTAPTIDRRFVVMDRREILLDWQLGVYNGQDFWAIAENIIARRPPGDNEASEYRIHVVKDFPFPKRRLRPYFDDI